MGRKALALMGLALILSGMVMGCTETQYENGGPTGGAVSQTQEQDIEILDHQKEYTDYGNLIITGTAKNVAGRQLSYAEIRVRFYDSEGNVLDSSLDNILDLDAGQTWSFEVVYLALDEHNVADYDVAVGTVW